MIYEEVARVPPFRRKTLVLIGAQGVGRRSLKNKLLVSDPQHYGTTVPRESHRANAHNTQLSVLRFGYGYFHCIVRYTLLKVGIAFAVRARWKLMEDSGGRRC